MKNTNWRMEFDWVGDFHEGRAMVKKDGKEGHIDKNGKVEWEKTEPNEHNILEKEVKSAPLSNSTCLDEYLTDNFPNACIIANRPCKTKHCMGWDEAKNNCKLVLFLDAFNAKENLDTNTNWKKKFDYIWPFFEGRAVIRKGGNCGHIDRKGRVTTPIIYDYTYSFSEGRAVVGKDKKCGHVDLEGKVTTPLIYDDVGSFYGGRAGVRKDGKEGHVDLDGKVEWDTEPNEHTIFDKEVRENDSFVDKPTSLNKSSCLDEYLDDNFPNACIIANRPCKTKYCMGWNEVKNNCKLVMLLDVLNAKENLNIINDWRKEYDFVGSFHEGRAMVRKDGKCGHVDLDGKVTTPLIYDDVGSFHEGRAWVRKEEKYGHVDLDGKVTTPVIYDDVESFSEGRARVKRDGKWGYVDLDGKIEWD